jgi:DNA-directed RNA polymerase subunit L
LKTNDFLSFECKLIKNNSENAGSFFSPVCGCIYTFKMDDKEINTVTKNMSENEKKTFMTQDNERIYEKNKIGDPKIYKFNFELSGFYDAKTILKKSINVLITKLMNIKNEFKNVENSNIITLRNNINNFYYFLIDNENETLGQLLTTYFNDDKNISYCGYVIEHPLKKNILLKIKLEDINKNKDLANIIITISENIDYLINLLNKILNDI